MPNYRSLAIVALLFAPASGLTLREETDADMFNIMTDKQLNKQKDEDFKHELRAKNIRMYNSIIKEPDQFENDHDAYNAALIQSSNEDLVQINDPNEEAAVAQVAQSLAQFGIKVPKGPVDQNTIRNLLSQAMGVQDSLSSKSNNTSAPSKKSLVGLNRIQSLQEL